MDMLNVVSFSGGKDSTAMLLMMIEKGYRIDRILFVDTTKEFPAMYKHIAEVQEEILPLTIDTVEINFDYWFAEHIKTKGKNKGEMGYGWASNGTRWCTSLKRQITNRHLRGLKYRLFQGIAVDETTRLSKNKDGRNIVYPLAEWGITEKQALEYCYSKGFNWDGLYEQFNRVSCWCCPLKRQEEYYNLRKFHPDLWAELKLMDSKTDRKFKTSYSLDELEQKINKKFGGIDD